MTSIEVSDRDHGRTVTLPRGAVVVVHLQENPTTGYRWAVVAQGGMRLDADTFTPGSAPGSAGLRHFTWVAETPGVHRVELSMRRAWAGDSASIGRFELNVECVSG